MVHLLRVKSIHYMALVASGRDDLLAGCHCALCRPSARSSSPGVAHGGDLCHRRGEVDAGEEARADGCARDVDVEPSS